MMMMIIMMIMIMTMVMLMIMATGHGEPELHFNQVAPATKRIDSFLFLTRTRAPTHGQDESRSKEVTR